MACIALRAGYVANGGRPREHHWVLCGRKPGEPWKLWAGSETKEGAERIRDGMADRMSKPMEREWLLVGPGGV